MTQTTRLAPSFVTRILVVLGVLLAACSEARADQLAGLWQAQVANETVALELRADGTGTLDDEPGTWRATRDTITLSGEDGSFTGRITHDALVFELQGTRIEFRRAQRRAVPPITGCWRSYMKGSSSGSSTTIVTLAADGTYRWQSRTSYGGYGSSGLDEAGTWTIAGSSIRFVPNGGAAESYTYRRDGSALYLGGNRYLSC